MPLERESTSGPRTGAGGGLPVVIDTDPGIDDAIALMLALSGPELDVRAVTTVGGNAGLDTTTANALRLLHLLGRDDIPVGAGADVPLVRRDSRPAESVHGADGLGGIRLEPAPRPADRRAAVELIRDVVDACEEPVTLIALGPLTNVAALLASSPATAAGIGRVVMMGGGARVLGNMTPTAEFNIWYDPEAAARVLSSGVPVTMVGLDVTGRARTVPGDWAGLHGGGPVAQAVLGMVEFYTGFYRASSGTDAIAQHDALAVASVMRPGLVTTRRLHVDVECAGSLTRGMTVVDIDGIGAGEPRTDVALDLDVRAFTAFLVERVVGLDVRTATAPQEGRAWH
jgi:pyrimidine-specific ribonucleoside hydrolase